MKICQFCHCECDDSANYCTSCGRPLNDEAKIIYADPYDHTSEFTEEDIKDNKLFAAISYLFGFPGIIAACICSNKSKFTMFHIKESLKINIVSVIALIILVLLFWTVLVPIVASIFLVILAVITVINFFSALQGKAKEAPMVRRFKFLK